MALPQHLIDIGYEEVSSDRDESRSIKMVDGYCVYLTSDQQNELDAFRKTLEDEKPTMASFEHNQVITDNLLQAMA